MPRFADRVAVITGGAGGMGLACAQRLAEEGATVALLDLKPPPGALLDDPRFFYFEGDLTDEVYVSESIEELVDSTGRLDYLVNAAGLLMFGHDRSILDIEWSVWNKAIAVNLTAAALVARYAIPAMQESGGGAMVHVSSTQCYRGDDKPQDAYQVAKAGIIALSKSLAIQFAREGIRSNVLVPGPTVSPMQARWEDNPGGLAAVESAVPLGRAGSVEDMAGAICFLLSADAAYITGTELIVDGGLLARP